jgi:hypothetical protein
MPYVGPHDGITYNDNAMIQVLRERRNGYAWHGGQPQSALQKYASWKHLVITSSNAQNTAQ